MSSIPANLPLRNDLIGEEPYGAPQLDVPVCLNVNENPYAPDQAVCEAIAKRVLDIAPTLNCVRRSATIWIVNPACV